MSVLKVAWLRIRSVLSRHAIESDLNDELRFHVEQQVEKNLRAGMSREGARRDALIKFGGLERIKESARDELRPVVVEDAIRDLRYALRALRRSPGFTVVSSLTLALGIGASTAIFTLVDSVLLRPLPFPQPERLAMIRPTSGSRLSAAYLHEWRLRSRSIQDMAGWRDERANLTDGVRPLEVLVDRTTANYFATLGVPPLLGRTFTASADLSRVESEVVLSHGFWLRRYGGARDIIGQSMMLDGKPFTIVGVMPEGFTIRTNELAGSRAELWAPFALMPTNWTGMGGVLTVVARLKADASVARARSDLSLIAHAIEEQHPSYSRDWGVEVLPLLDATVNDVRPTLLVLFGAVAILLLIACANVANLVLGRAATRQSEMAIRRSLGATDGRLVRQLLAESLALALLGGVLGVIVAIWGTELLVAALPAGFQLPRVQEIGVNVRVLSFAVAVTMLSAIGVGLVPSFRSALSASPPALQDVTRGNSPGPTRNRIAGALVISEVALALILLAGAALLSRSFWELIRVDPGFEPDQVLTMRTTLPASKYDTDDRVRAFSTALLGRIAGLPGVRAVGSSNYLPMSRFGAAARFEIAGRPEARMEDQKFSWVTVVGGRYFEAMGIPLLRGRLPGHLDSHPEQPIFVIDEQLARRYWPNADPVGARLTWNRGENKPLSGEIVGVVGRVRSQSMAGDSPPPMAYWWFPNAPNRELTVVLRTQGSVDAIGGLLSGQVRELDPNQPMSELGSMQDLVSADLARPRLTMLIVAGFAAVALVMAAIGLYGLVAFMVAQRTREIGVRMALGAQYRDVLQLVMRRGAVLVGTGLAIGVVSTLVLGRFVASLLYGVTPSDPATLLAVSLFLAAVALVATYFPARRAARVEPMVALSAE